MSGSTISKLITHTVTLGNGAYLSPLTLTSAGKVIPQKAGAMGVTVPSYSATTLISYGTIAGGGGTIGSTGTAGSSSGGIVGQGIAGGNGGAGSSGGIGVYLAGLGTFTNHGVATGAAGGAGGTGGNGVSGGTNAGAYAGNGGAGGTGGIGVVLSGAGDITNAGTIDGGAGGSGGTAGTGKGGVKGTGGKGGVGVSLSGGALLTNSVFISGGAGGDGGASGGKGGAGVYLNGATLINAGTIEGGTGGAGAVNGSVGAAVQFGSLASLLIVDPGASFIGNVIAQSSAFDILELSGTSTAALPGIGTQFLNFSEISFASDAAWTIAGNSAGLAAGITIAGFTQADMIDLTNFAATTETYVSGVGLVLSNASLSETLHLTGSFSTADFQLVADGASGTLIEDVNCFARGTRIATAVGDVPVEGLKIGMEVKTLHAGLRRIKWIGRRSYTAPFVNHVKVLPICIKAGAIVPGVPARDLFVSPGHGICIDGALVHASRLVNGVTIFQVPAVDVITYFHIELDSHDVIYAENCPAETFIGERFRGQFENAVEFQQLYPGHVAPEASCRPLLEQGFRLHNILCALSRRAGIRKTSRRAGGLRGFIDQAGPECLTGWAQDLSSPEHPVCLDVFSGARFIRRIIANLYREDLRSAGIGSGNHAFSLQLPAKLSGPITVCRSVDNAILPLTGVAMEHAA
ncbi:MAG: Hint domain-containing protein [Acidocella sp.]|nr:Hint domain-containing protein [Acidocella sp.]